MRISDGSSDVCASDLGARAETNLGRRAFIALVISRRRRWRGIIPGVAVVITVPIAVVIALVATAPIHIAAAVAHLARTVDQHRVVIVTRPAITARRPRQAVSGPVPDRKNTRLNSSH